MLFEREPSTPKGRLAALNRLFADAAHCEGDAPAQGHVPLEVLAAYGDLASHVRFMLDSADKRPHSKEQRGRMLKIERLMDSLPEYIMATLPAGPEDNWLAVYRKLALLHGLLEETEPPLDTDEYAALVQKIIHLAGSVAKASAVKVDASSMFTLLLIQVHLHKYAPIRRRCGRRKAKVSSSAHRKKASP